MYVYIIYIYVERERQPTDEKDMYIYIYIIIVCKYIFKNLNLVKQIFHIIYITCIKNKSNI